MQAAFQEIVLQFALSGLVAALVAIPVCAAFRRLRTQCRALNALTWTLAAPFLLVALTVGGTKTNGVNNLPPQHLTLPRPTLQMLNTLPPAGGAVNLADPVQAGQSAAFAADWNVCGAWKDSFWLPFADGWTFPWGTNHLPGIEVVSYGRLWPTPFDTNAVAFAGAPFEIVPGLTSFSYELTPSNSYRFAWTHAAIGRDTNNLVAAVLELFRNGDRSVTTNGVTAYLPRILPFAHDGFGQDAEWVAANFTNATEIAAAGGYAAWVDAQVGTGLTNGLYKFTAIFPYDPPETIELFVGDYSVAVTNAGEYVFVLEKGEEYTFGTWPYDDDVEYDIQDDLVEATPLLRSWWGGWGAPGEWTVDGGWNWLYYPGLDYPGYCRWMPTLQGSPNVPHLSATSFPVTFEAIVADYSGSTLPVYQWESSDENILFATPHAQSTAVHCSSIPSWTRAGIAVTATIGGYELCSLLDDFTYGVNATPQVHCSFSAPSALLVRNQWMEGSESATVHVSFQSDIATNGTLRIWVAEGSGRIDTTPSLPTAVQISEANALVYTFAVDGVAQSEVSGDVRLCCGFEAMTGETNAVASVNLTVVSPKRILIPGVPDTGLCVLQGSDVAVSLEIEPLEHVVACWQTAKRKTKDLYDPWVVRGAGFPNTTLSLNEAGVFALRAISIFGGGCQSNVIEYVHVADEPDISEIEEPRGPNKRGSRNHIGVAATQRLLAIRNAALAHLGLPEYTVHGRLSARNGFSAVSADKYKCNRFVADMVFEAGYTVPAIHIVHHNWPIPDSAFPPIANEWANGGVAIPGWTYLGRNVYPEPGFIAGNPFTPIGHCGIVDYDGWTISARYDGISRMAMTMLDGTCGYNKPAEDDNNEQ